MCGEAASLERQAARSLDSGTLRGGGERWWGPRAWAYLEAEVLWGPSGPKSGREHRRCCGTQGAGGRKPERSHRLVTARRA